MSNERHATDKMKDQPAHEASVLGHREMGGLIYSGGKVLRNIKRLFTLNIIC